MTSACFREEAHRLSIAKLINRLESGSCLLDGRKRQAEWWNWRGAIRGKRRGDDIEGIEVFVGAAEWASRNLGTERAREEFVVVVVGKRGVRNLNIILSLLQLVSHPHFRKCGILVFLI